MQRGKAPRRFQPRALYYELKEDYAHALECYTKSGDHAKISELLIRNSELHPGMGHYSEMEKVLPRSAGKRNLGFAFPDAGNEYALRPGNGL